MATLLRALDGESIQVFKSGNANKFLISMDSSNNLNFALDAGSATLSISGTAVSVTGTITASSTLTATRLISTIGTGTAPLTVASTTKVSNLNADLLDDMNADSTATVSTIVARDSSANVTANAFVSGDFSIKYNTTTSTLDFIYTP